ncbi:chondroitinase-B domain-containing protein [Rhodothermus marinus]|uniref:T9SS type A sorting domain-containing protein n=2 Tax=Rhodothermus marinus TaxID=29549 RepID=D0MIG7_RHOM4|nr:chondroitinase-B domain-containing protein [Rhodothermus marinus]ACY48275.1 hypothetical protein Rmar_1386 [Rhodothermus marinus DSM 4252]
MADSLRKPLMLLGLSFCLISVVRGQTVVLNTSFEEFAPGSIHQQDDWLVEEGQALISDSSRFVHSGSQGLFFQASNEKLVVRYIPFAAADSGISGVVYLDVWVRIEQLETKDFAINGYDLYGGSQKRAFVLEFDTPSGTEGKFQVYDGSSKVVVQNYQLGQWHRISARVDYQRGIYQVIFDQSEAVTVNFRENYTPSRPDARKEFHELRFNLGYDGAVGTVAAAIDDLYIGTDPIPDVTFPPTEVYYTIQVEQPAVGRITLDPDQEQYLEGTWVTATLELPEGYINLGWTGDLSGTELVKEFQVFKDMVIGAEVGIDSLNPPPRYRVEVIQPDTGRITLDPPGGEYYAHTTVTATLELPPGFINLGWTGDLSGTELEKTFVVLKDMTIGAVVVEDTTPPMVYTVRTAEELKSVLRGELRPGDIVEVEDGVYDTGGGITIEASGTETKPIIIRAKNIGLAELTGKTYFTFRKSSYIILEGFKFTSNVYTAVKLEACHHIRITRNIFQLDETGRESSKWIVVGGYYADPSLLSHHNRIDHNIFRDKQTLGNFITIDGGDVVSQHDRIDHNYFYNIGPRAENEKEAIRVGWSELSLTDGYTVIEYNLFERCDGDPEIVSIKSSKDTVRYNTFRASQGSLTLRHGNGSVVYGNFFLGEGREGTGGVRVYAKDHKIYNNYFEGLTGSVWDAAITLTNGDTDEGSLSAHWRVQNVLIAHNTLVNNYSNIEIGYARSDNSWKKEPRNVQIINNLVVAGELTNRDLITIYTEPTDFVWAGNIMYPKTGYGLGITADPAEIFVADPLLEENNGLWVLSAQSPAVDAGSSLNFSIMEDFQGQPRDALPDVGADELSSAPVLRRPLQPEDVGPFASDSISTSVEVRSHRPAQTVLKGFPNPFITSTVLAFSLPERSQITLFVYDMLGREVARLYDGELEAGSYRLVWQPEDELASGIYLVVLTTDRGTAAYKLALIR